MGAPTVYRWDDTDAPVLNGYDGTALIALLKACLVDGYGEKAAAGWSMPFDNGLGTKGAFCNVAGSGCFLLINNTASNNTATVLGYESMVDINSGSGLFGGGGTRYVRFSSSTDTQPRPWVLIADDRFFYLFDYAATTTSNYASNSTYCNTCNPLFFGDGISLHVDDNYFTVLGASDANYDPTYNTASRYFAPYYPSTTTDYIMVPRNASGDTGTFKVGLKINGGPIEPNINYYSIKAANRGSRDIISRPYINNSAAYAMRGWLPGLWLPCCAVGGFVNNEEITVNNVNYMIVHTGSGATTNQVHWAIDITEGFRP